MITQEYLQSLFQYNPKTGEMWWIKKRSNNTRLFRPFEFTGASHGYIVIRLDNKLQLMHRLAWIYSHGEIPDGAEIDHANGNKLDNRMINLRLSTHSENNQNKPITTRNTSGFKGVHYNKNNNSWSAEVKSGDIRIREHGFNTAQDASNRAVEIRRNLHKEFCNHG